MKISDAIREITTGASGFDRLFNRGRSYYELSDIVDEGAEFELFAELLYGCAKEMLVSLVNDAYNYHKHVDEIADKLCYEDYGSDSEVRAAVEHFLRAFGFPEYRGVDDSHFGEIVLDDRDDMRVLYSGEVYDGIPHGIGTKRTYRAGNLVRTDESNWIFGRMTGYCRTTELGSDGIGTEIIGFVINEKKMGVQMNIDRGGNGRTTLSEDCFDPFGNYERPTETGAADVVKMPEPEDIVAPKTPDEESESEQTCEAEAPEMDEKVDTGSIKYNINEEFAPDSDHTAREKRIAAAMIERCEDEDGFSLLFEKSKSYWKLSGDMREYDFSLTSEMLWRSGKEKMIALINDPEHYEYHASEVVSAMVTEGEYDEDDSRSAVRGFLRAFGYPVCKRDGESERLSLGKDGQLDLVYDGEVKDGEPHGYGKISSYSGSTLVSSEEGSFVCGKLLGYCVTVAENARTIAFMVYDEIVGPEVTFENGNRVVATFDYFDPFGSYVSEPVPVDKPAAAPTEEEPDDETEETADILPTPDPDTVDDDSDETEDDAPEEPDDEAYDDDTPDTVSDEDIDFSTIDFDEIAEDGKCFIGYTVGGERFFGKETEDGGEKYFGEYRGGVRSGKGVLVSENGDCYFGSMKDGVRHGKGVLYDESTSTVRAVHCENGEVASRYDATERSELSGLYEPLEEVEIGEYSFMQMYSCERVKDSDAVYVGDTDDGNANGVGRMVYADGTTLYGEWQDGVQNGHAMYLDPGIMLEVGTLVDGELSGFGARADELGILVGRFASEGAPDGDMYRYLNTGDVYLERYENGSFDRTLSRSERPAACFSPKLIYNESLARGMMDELPLGKFAIIERALASVDMTYSDARMQDPTCFTLPDEDARYTERDEGAKRVYTMGISGSAQGVFFTKDKAWYIERVIPTTLGGDGTVKFTAMRRGDRIVTRIVDEGGACVSGAQIFTADGNIGYLARDGKAEYMLKSPAFAFDKDEVSFEQFCRYVREVDEFCKINTLDNAVRFANDGESDYRLRLTIDSMLDE